MPHLTLKHSKNLEKDFSDFFSEAHKLIAQILQVNIKSCRSIATSYEQYFIGKGETNNAFIHLDILIKPKYEHDKLQLLGTQILELLKYHLKDKNNSLNIKISLELLEVGSNYFS